MAPAVDDKKVLRHVEAHPGCRCADIAGALGVDAKAVSPVLKELMADGKARCEGSEAGDEVLRGSQRVALD